MKIKNVLEDNEDVMWTFNEGHDIQHILIVSKPYYFWFYSYLQNTRPFFFFVSACVWW